jgi:hypothetical protein
VGSERVLMRALIGSTEEDEAPLKLDRSSSKRGKESGEREGFRLHFAIFYNIRCQGFIPRM